MSQRNSHIINHTLWIFLMVSIVSGIVIQLNSTIDSIVVGQYIGADSISVVALAMPLVNLLLLPSVMMMMGTCILIAPALGNQDYSRANKLVTIGLVCFLALNILLAVLLGIFTEQTSSIMTTDPRLAPMLQRYMPYAFIGSILAMFANYWAQLVKIYGESRLITWYSIIFVAVNTVFDLVLVKVMGVGIVGIAGGTSVASVLSFFVMMPFLRREPRPFRFCMPGWKEFRGLLRETLHTGLSSIMAGVSTILLTIGLNTIVLSRLGADGMFPLSICMQLLLIAMLIYTAVGTSVTGLGGILMGEQDSDGVRRLIRSALRSVVIASLVAMAVLLVIPGPIASIFGADAHFRALSVMPIRTISFMLVPAGVIMVLCNFLLLLGYNKLAGLSQVLMILCILPLAVILSAKDPDWFWYSIPVGMALASLFSVIASVYAYRRWNITDNKVLVMSVDYCKVDFAATLSTFTAHVKDLGLEPNKEQAVIHCIEEIMLHELEMARQCSLKGGFDLGIARNDKRLTIMVKAIGKPYNPMVKYHTSDHDDNPDDLQLSMSIVEGFCDSLDYRYRSGVNSLYVNFN